MKAKKNTCLDLSSGKCSICKHTSICDEITGVVYYAIEQLIEKGKLETLTMFNDNYRENMASEISGCDDIENSICEVLTKGV